jgi:chaperonin cofactor prefoldin
MVTVDTLQTEVRDLKRRLELTETRVTQLEGRFEFVSGQLRDIQLYMHAKFGDVESRLDRVEAQISGLTTEVSGMKREMNARFSEVNAKIDALPRVLAELIAKR